MAVLPTYTTLYGDATAAINHYKSLFPSDITTGDATITAAYVTAFTKILPVFGRIRNYDIAEDTLRNEHIKNAITLEVEAIITANAGSATITEGGLNDGDGNESGTVVEEKMGNITTKYSGEQSQGSKLASTLGLLSINAGVTLARFIARSVGWSAGEVY